MFELLIGVIIFGLIMGSFFNVVIHRLPLMLFKDWRMQAEEFLKDNKSINQPDTPSPYNLFVPRSACPSCHQQLRAWHNIPVLSFLLLRGQCAYCHASISWRYPLIEILTVILGVLATLHFGASISLLFVFIFIGILLPASFIDLEYQILPDELTLGLLWVGLLANAFELFATSKSAIIGAAAGYLFLYVLGRSYQLISGREGIGYGDYKLLAAMGAWLGWQLLPLVLFMASLLGSIIGLSFMFFKGHDRYKPIPFGPYLSLSGFITLLWGDKLITTYFHSISM